MEHHRKFVKDVVILGFVTVITRAKGIVLLMMLSKTLGAENYGIWTQIFVTLSFVAPIAILGLPYALARFLPEVKTIQEKREHIWSVFFIIFSTGTLLVLPFLFFEQFFASFLHIPVLFISLVAFLIVLEILNSFLTDLFRVLGSIWSYAFLNFGLTFGEILFTAIVLLSGGGLFGAVSVLVLTRILMLFFAIIFLIKKIGFMFPKFNYVKKYLKFGLPTIFSNLSHWIVQVSDRYFIANFLGVLFVGYYAPAYTIGLIIAMCVPPMILILQPAVSRLFVEKNFFETRRYLSYSLKYVLFITVPAAFGLSVLARPILLFSSTLEIATHGYAVVPFIALSIIPYGIYAVFSQVFFLFKKTSTDGLIWIAAALLALILNFILIPKFGIMGGAWSTIITYSIVLVLTIIFTRSLFSFPIDWRFGIKTIVASSVMAGLILLFSVTEIYQLGIAILIGIVVYLFLMLIMGGLEKKEIIFFYTLFKNPKGTIKDAEIIQ
jgi:O-antigen/teichoic acid export membrane protein